MNSKFVCLIIDLFEEDTAELILRVLSFRKRYKKYRKMQQEVDCQRPHRKILSSYSH